MLALAMVGRAAVSAELDGGTVSACCGRVCPGGLTPRRAGGVGHPHTGFYCVDMTIRADLLDVLARRALTEDSARPDALEKLHARGGTSAREHIARIVDPGSFVEYGRFVTAAQESRRSTNELLDRTVADGIVGGGVATIDGRSCAVLSYDYLVMAGTQGGMRGHRKTDRLLDVIGRLGLPTVFVASGGGGGRPR